MKKVRVCVRRIDRKLYPDHITCFPLLQAERADKLGAQIKKKLFLKTKNNDLVLKSGIQEKSAQGNKTIN